MRSCDDNSAQKIMKILVFADFHGSINALNKAVEISQRERCDKVVVCGDMFGWSNPSEVVNALQKLDGVPYLVKGNNDWSAAADLLPCELEDNALMYHFSRTLFFTHGDRYNGFKVPPMLKEGDALVYGHTHMGSLRYENGLFLLNVGSLARSRDGQPCYLRLDDNGATLLDPDGATLSHIDWQQRAV